MTKKSKFRVVKVPDEVRLMVDEAAQTDEELKNLTFRNKAYRTKLVGAVSGSIQPDEASIKVEGEKAAATVTRRTTTTLDMAAENFPEVKQAVEDGLLEGVVSKSLSLRVPGDAVERAVEILKEAGFDVGVDANYSLVDVADINKPSVVGGDSERAAAHDLLSKSLKEKVVHQVKFAMKEVK